MDKQPSNGQLLDVNNIEVVYNHVVLVLKGLSLQVPEGGIIALLGSNGAGKSTVRKAISVPLTIKIRSGWDSSGRQALDIARRAEACGVDALTMHPRSAGQGFRGQADWSLIAAVKSALKIPVIGNGDIVVAQDALRMLS